MGKRVICLLLALLILLSGCEVAVSPTESTPEETSGHISANTEGTQAQNTETTGTQATEGERQIPKVEDIAYLAPAYEGEQKIPYDPDWQIYIPFINQDMDYYPSYWFGGITGIVITREHYPVEEIQVKVPAKTPHDVFIDEIVPPTDLLPGENWDSPVKLLDYQYLCQQGIDWQEFAQLALNSEAASTILHLYRKEMKSEAQRDSYQVYYEKLCKVEKEYQALCDAQEDPQTPFYAYLISFRFTGIGDYEETVESIEFVFGDEHYTVDIGQWRFHKERPEELKLGSTAYTGLTQTTRVISELYDCMYNGGYAKLNDVFQFTATKDLTVTGIRQLGVEVNALGARVVISGEKSADFYWDLQQPLEIQQGDTVAITLYLKDERFTQYDVGITTYFIMDYEVKDKPFSISTPCLLCRLNTKSWDVYLMLAENCDVGEYYTCYYVPLLESWIRDLPEEWQQ